MKKLLILCFLAICSLGNAQISTRGWTPVIILVCTRLELTSINNKAFLSFGPKIPISENDYVSLRGHFNWWDASGKKLVVIPELDYFRKIKISEKESDILTGIYGGAGVTPNWISPKAGFTFYHFFTAEAGYNFEYSPYKHFSGKGFRYSIGINAIF